MNLCACQNPYEDPCIEVVDGEGVICEWCQDCPQQMETDE